jgi:hypothetical protein
MGKAETSPEPLGGKFLSKPGDFAVTQCAYCVHLITGTGELGSGGGCPAFPNQIPLEIWENRFDHRRRHRDEYRPVRLEFRPDVPAAVTMALEAVLDEIP